MTNIYRRNRTYYFRYKNDIIDYKLSLGIQNLDLANSIVSLVKYHIGKNILGVRKMDKIELKKFLKHCVVDALKNFENSSNLSAMEYEIFDLPIETRAQANQAIFEYIEVFYNRQRMHSANGNLSPVEFEEKMLLKVTAA